MKARDELKSKSGKDRRGGDDRERKPKDRDRSRDRADRRRRSRSNRRRSRSKKRSRSRDRGRSRSRSRSKPAALEDKGPESPPALPLPEEEEDGGEDTSCVI